MKQNGSQKQHGSQSVALVSSYSPRQCGIAVFAKNLRDALADEIGPARATVLAIDDGAADYDYPDEVRFLIPQHRQVDYINAADLINTNPIDIVYLQHEYGIFGGKDGAQVLEFVRQLRKPVITTLHTVLESPSTSQRSILKELARHSDRVVVMSEKARDLLGRIYSVPSSRIVHIPHGIPDMPFVDPQFYKDQFGVEGRRVILTFGLLSPGKGIEVAIRAIADVVKEHPDIIYFIVGATHPHVIKNEGHAYRNSLERLVDKLGLNDHVVFHNRFVSAEELGSFLGVADIYITPYPNRQQITSGTLCYALGSGTAVVSTPYWHAEELLADGRGRLFDFGDSAGLAKQVNELLDDEHERLAIRKKAYLYTRPMVWDQVAKSYLALAREVQRDRKETPRRFNTALARTEATETLALPEIDLSHLRRLTDSTGILQHAVYSIPDRHHGYCIDDNARAMLVALLHHDLTNDETILPLVDSYLAFLHHGFNTATGRFRNFMSYERKWLEESGSDDSHGRAVWALGAAVRFSPKQAVGSLSRRLFNDALPALDDLKSPRAMAFALTGIHHYLERYSGDTTARRMRQLLGDRLHARFIENAVDDWPWCEDSCTYDNGHLALALILTGHDSGDAAMLNMGLKSLQWLASIQKTPQGAISLIGCDGWLHRDGKRARFDQQPVEAMCMVQACAAAWRATADESWYDLSQEFLEWFLGQNELGLSVYDYQTGGCRDGLTASGLNLNQGAESVLAWLISLLTVMSLHRDRSTVPEAEVVEQ